MTAGVIQLRDWDWLRPIEGPMRTEPAEVVILPAVRVERATADIVEPKPARRARKSLLGDP